MLFASEPSSLENLSIRPMEFSVALLDFVVVVSNILAAVGPSVDSFTVEFAVSPSTVVGSAVLPGHGAFAVIFIVEEESIEPVTGRRGQGALARSGAVGERTDIDVADRVGHLTLSVRFAVLPFADVDVAIVVEDSDLARSLISNPEAFIDGTGRCDEGSSALSLTEVVLTLIGVTILVPIGPKNWITSILRSSTVSWVEGTGLYAVLLS